jgi:hypothetical protein
MSNPMRRWSAIPESFASSLEGAGGSPLEGGTHESGTRRAIRRRDTRRTSRVPFVRDVLLQIEGGEWKWAVSRDISLGGMFIQSSTPSPFGARVSVSILKPTPLGEFRIEGAVRWTDREGMGIQFGLMGARTTHELIQLIEEALRGEAGTPPL